jgi:hypothetical protein
MTDLASFAKSGWWGLANDVVGIVPMLTGTGRDFVSGDVHLA